MERPNYLPSSGHVGHFVEPESSDVPEGTIKFQGLRAPPFALFERNFNKNFTAFGHWFSLLYETAKKLNYSIVGRLPPQTTSDSEIYGSFLEFQPDIWFVPFIAQIDALMQALQMGLMKITGMVYTVELDHILSAKKYKRENLMSMLAPFDTASLLLMSFGLLCIALIARYFKLRPGPHAFNDVVWNLATALICSPHVTAKKAVWRFVGITWLLGVFLLQQLFAGEMFMAMTLAPGLDVVETFDQLALKTTGPISVVSFKGRDYFSPFREHYDILTRRMRVLTTKDIFDKEVLESNLLNVSKGEQYFLADRLMLEHHQIHYSSSKDTKASLYISQEFGEPMPLFLSSYGFEDSILEAFNIVLIQTRESGIYDNWMKFYLNPWKENERRNEKDEVEFMPAQAKHFKGLFVICFGFLMLAIFVMFRERSGNRKSRRKAW